MLTSLTPEPGSRPTAVPQLGEVTIPSIIPIQPQIIFREDQSDRVKDFCCARPGENEKRWEEDVSRWIKSGRGDGGAIDAVRLGRAQVWLYEDSNQRLLGFGSLGAEIWIKEMGADLVTETVYTIPYFGIQGEFRGQPTGDVRQRYAWRIFQGLLDEAEASAEYPFIILYVDPDNPAVTKFYPEFGFIELDRIKEDERDWVRLIRKVRSFKSAILSS